jgi:hypothetical protein
MNARRWLIASFLRPLLVDISLCMSRVRVYVWPLARVKSVEKHDFRRELQRPQGLPNKASRQAVARTE